MYLTLADVKTHLRIDSDFTDDDDYIELLISVAEEATEQHLNVCFSERFGEGELPSPIIHAMKLLIGTLYANRESAAEKGLQKCEHTYDYLLSLYRNHSIG